MKECSICGKTEANMRLAEQAIAATSHDLRAPLTSIQFSLQLLAQELAGVSSPSALEELFAASANAERVLGLVDQLLNDVKLQNGGWSLRLADTKIATVVERSIQSVEPLSRAKKIRISCSFGADCTTCTIHADADSLVRVLVNLISNAIKFSPVNTHIRVSVRKLHNSVRFVVKDEGPGIEPELQKAIFEPFVQADPNCRAGHRGVGLGLAICKTIISQHGGSIGVRSKSGLGSKFWFRIPINAASLTGSDVIGSLG